MGRRIVIGALGLILTVVWAMAFLYQRDNVDFLIAVFLADAPTAIRLSSLWSVLQIWMTALLVLPVVAASIGTMFAARPMVRVLRIAVATGAVLSVGVLMIFAGVAAPSVLRGGPVLLTNPRIYYELLVALGTLGLQIVLLVLLRRCGHHTGSAFRVSAARDESQKPDQGRQPSSRDPQLAAIPAPPFAARG